MLLFDSVRQSAPETDVRYTAPAPSLWRTVQHLWCRHADTFRTERTEAMPAHTVCRSCGWREPVEAVRPRGVRTWDSSRDQARYELEKSRRAALELQRQLLVAELAGSATKDARSRRARLVNVVDIARLAAH